MQFSMIRVLVVHNHPIIRRGLVRLLGESLDVEIVGEAASGEEAIALLEQVHPDVILLDLVLPGMGGVRAIREIHTIAPNVKIIVLTNIEDRDRVQEALQAGATMYLLNDIATDQLLNGIRRAARGVASPERGAALTDREREVLALVAQGLSNHAIAERLVIAPASVKFHLRNIRSKLGPSGLS